MVIILLAILCVYLIKGQSKKRNHDRTHPKRTKITTGNEILIHLTEGILAEWLKDKILNDVLYLNNDDDILPKNIKISKIDSNTFNQMSKSLSILHLDHNLINDIDQDTFFELNNLKVLRLDFNRLQAFNLKISEKNQLESLYLNNNQIHSIGFDTFLNLNKLLVLDLSFNRLMRLTFNYFAGLTSLRKYCLNNNEINDVIISALEITRISKESFCINFEQNNLPDLLFSKLKLNFKCHNIKC
jgi:Leucine-rich repeat (LRR) protein